VGENNESMEKDGTWFYFFLDFALNRLVPTSLVGFSGRGYARRDELRAEDVQIE
jgi:hypothetical protein